MSKGGKTPWSTDDPAGKFSAPFSLSSLSTYYPNTALKELDHSRRISLLIKISVLFPLLPVSFLDFYLWACQFSLPYHLLCFQNFLMHFSSHLLCPSAPEFTWFFFKLSISLAKYLFCSLILFWAQRTACVFLQFTEFLHDSYLGFSTFHDAAFHSIKFGF